MKPHDLDKVIPRIIGIAGLVYFTYQLGGYDLAGLAVSIWILVPERFYQ